MLAAGFLASPVLQREADVLDLYTGARVTRPGAWSVELIPGEERFWKPTVSYRVYKIENRLGRCVARKGLSDMTEFTEAVTTKLREQLANTQKPPRPFVLFRSARWRPGQPAPEAFQENLAFALFLALPLACLGAGLVFARRLRRHTGRVSWPWLITGNTLVLLFLISAALAVGEAGVRFGYDTTDSLGYTKVCERWVKRHWHVNGTGCRDDVEYFPRISPGKRRVSFVGDSFTAGHGIKDVADRFPNRLRTEHPDWEVHVLANVGLNTGAEIALLKKAFNQGYQTDEVVLVYCLNDIGDLLPDEQVASEAMLSGAEQGNWIVQNSYLINLLYHHYRASRVPFFRNYSSFVRDANRGEMWERQKARFRVVRDLVQARGARFSVVIFPLLNALGPNYEYQVVHDELDAAWRDLNVPCLDLLSVFKNYPPEPLTVNRYDAHPNEYANRLAAAAIDQWLSPRMDQAKTRERSE